MAPSAVETITVPEVAATKAKFTGVAEYKELAPVGYSKVSEEEGEHKAKYTHYLPTVSKAVHISQYDMEWMWKKETVLLKDVN